MPKECRMIRAEGTYEGKQGFSYFEGIREAHGKGHKHETHETAIYVLSGDMVMYWGDRLQHRMGAAPGDLVYIPADVPHLPVNLGAEEATAVIARTDPHEQESVVLLPELEALVPA